MEKDHQVSRIVTNNLTAFRSIVLGMLLVLALTACGFRLPVQPTQAAVPSRSASPSPQSQQSTLTPQATRPASRYVTRTPTSGPPQPTATPVKTLDVMPEELSGQKITFWHPWQGKLGEVLQAIIDEYNRTNHWGVEVEVRTFESFGSLEQAFDTALVTGDRPSLLTAYDDRAQHWNQNGQALVNLQAYVGDPIWGLSHEEQVDFYPAFWQQGIAYVRDGRGGVTTRQESIPLHRSALVLFYNQSWAAELGHTDFPDTPFELRTQVCDASQVNRSIDKSGKTGGLMISSLLSSTPGKQILLQPEQLLGWVGGYGGQVELPEGQGYLFNTPETQRALEFLHDLHEDGCVYISDSPTPADEFAARQGLIYIASTAELASIKAAFSALESQDEWTVLPFPTANGAANMVAYGPSLIIPQTNRLQQLAAWTLLEWLVYPPNQARWAQAVGAYPTRFSTNDLLGSAISADPAWAVGLDLLPDALAEPPLPSWSVVRWTMADALAELFTSGFELDQIPGLLESLDQVAAEINNQVR
jgi:multiple sugar transport system substrate-binding protein/sn-glycerol 3-phosphate transport system substrate-binding protein